MLCCYATDAFIKGDMRIYYDRSGAAVPPVAEYTIKVDNETDVETEVQSYGYLPCSCHEWTCGCCANIRFFSFRRQSK